MAALRRVADRIKTARLELAVSNAALAVKTHESICSRCKMDEHFPRNCCDIGWALYKEQRRAEQFLSVYTGEGQEGSSKVQGTLW